MVEAPAPSAAASCAIPWWDDRDRARGGGGARQSRNRCCDADEGAAGGEGGDVITVPAGVRVLVATKPVDFRRGADSLAGLAKEELQGDPFSGTIFVFRSKRTRSPRRLTRSVNSRKPWDVSAAYAFLLCDSRLPFSIQPIPAVPGDRVQMDTCKIRPRLYEFTAIDDCSRFLVAGCPWTAHFMKPAPPSGIGSSPGVQEEKLAALSLPFLSASE